MKFKVSVSQTVVRDYYVEADSLAEAREYFDDGDAAGPHNEEVLDQEVNVYQIERVS